MCEYSLVCAELNPELFYSAHDFLLKYEKEYCALMERILNKESSVYVILKNHFTSFSSEVCGVFSFNRGRSFTSCIPEINSKIKKLLCNFFNTHEIFCLIGPAESVKKIEEILLEKKNILPSEKREMFLMEYCGKNPAQVNAESDKIIKCNFSHADDLLLLQVNFSKEEVYPAWKTEANLAAERFSLDNSIKLQHVFAFKINELFVSKAQTNACTENYFQIGGVYTLPDYRKRGYAAELVKTIVNYGFLQNKKTVLYVRKENLSAIHSYEKAGFKNIADYCMIYYR